MRRLKVRGLQKGLKTSTCLFVWDVSVGGLQEERREIEEEREMVGAGS